MQLEVTKPYVKKKRRNAISVNKRKLEREVRKLKSYNCKLSDKQDQEMRKIVNVIENDFRPELQRVINDSSDEGSGKADVLRAVWEQDLKDRREFWTDQRRNSEQTVNIGTNNRNPHLTTHRK